MKLVSKISKKWWFKWLLVGVVIRLLLMPITLHPDLWGHSFTAYFFAYEGRINIYEHLLSLPDTHPLVQNFGVSDIFIYPPLTYFTLGLFRVLARPFSDANFIPWLMENLSQIHTYKGLLWHIFIFKLPYLFVDISLAFILASLFKEQRNKIIAFALWMFNPLTLYATFMIGQLDILPTFFTVLSIYFVIKKKARWAMVSLGVGGLYKIYPLLLVVPAALVLGKKLGDRIKYTFLGFLPYVLITLPFLGSVAFRQMVLFSPKSQKILFMNWPVSGAEGVFPFVIGLIIIYSYAYYSKKKAPLQYYFLAVLLLIFSVTHYHPQWFLWVTPFLIWELVENRFKHALLITSLFASWFIITLFFEPSLSLGLFNPIWPQLRDLTGLSELMARYFDPFLFLSLVRSLFAGSSLFLTFTLLSRQESKKV